VALALFVAACADPGGPIEIDLGAAADADGMAAITRTFTVDGERGVDVRLDRPLVVEAWADGAAFDGVTDAQLAAGAPASWRVPQAETGDLALTIVGDGEVTLSVFGRGAPPPPVDRDRGLAWLDPDLLDDPSVISFGRVMAAIAPDHHGGAMLARWFSAFADGPGAGRAAFAQWRAEIEQTQGTDPTAWDLDLLPMKITGIHDRLDLASATDCGQLRISIASTHPVFAPAHFIFLFRQPARDDDATPDGMVHCRGTARRWARLSELPASDWKAAARELLTTAVTGERFLLAESVELSISPWQWRQWKPDGAGGFVNPPLFQTVDTARVNAPGETRDAFLAEIAAHADEVAARTWTVPARFESQVAEVQPNSKASLVDLSGLSLPPEVPRAIGMIGCPRCHTDDADFVQTGIDRKPSPFYDRELDARAARLDALATGAFPSSVPFGPLQPL